MTEVQDELIGIISIAGEPINLGSLSWGGIENKPFETIGDNLVVQNGKLSVDTVSEVGDFTKPITASAVNTTVGNINALLELI